MYNQAIFLFDTLIDKITKIVRELWLAERGVFYESMQTWFWRQDVLLFARQSRKHEFENVFELKTRQVSFIYPFPRRLELWVNLYKHALSIFVRLSWHFRREIKNPLFRKHLFCKTRTDYTCKTSWTRLSDWWEFFF